MHAISVIISNFNGAKYLPRLIETLRSQRGVELQIIVVDRNSSDESDTILAANPDIAVIKHPPETGLVSGYHAGTGAAIHDLYFFMNEDMWLDSNCLSLCATLSSKNSRTAAVMPVQWTYDGTGIVNAAIWYQPCQWHRSLAVGTRRNRWHLIDQPAQIPYANAGACLIRRSAYETVGGWDTSFFLDDEDTDLCLRFWQHGLECWLEPAATVGHAVGASNSKTIPKTGSPVSRKRYIGALSNTMVVALKSFSWGALWRPGLVFLDRLMRDLIKCRFDAVFLDTKALMLTINRLGHALGHRRANRALIASRPGELFFKFPAFQYGAIEFNHSIRTSVPPG